MPPQRPGVPANACAEDSLEDLRHNRTRTLPPGLRGLWSAITLQRLPEEHLSQTGDTSPAELRVSEAKAAHAARRQQDTRGRRLVFGFLLVTGVALFLLWATRWRSNGQPGEPAPAVSISPVEQPATSAPPRQATKAEKPTFPVETKAASRSARSQAAVTSGATSRAASGDAQTRNGASKAPAAVNTVPKPSAPNTPEPSNAEEYLVRPR
ncbi:MAG: hypothetical protein QM784_40300 [Polyangiaceae bacterium]